MSLVCSGTSQITNNCGFQDTLPSNSATAALFIECPDDTVAEGWWLDEATDTLHEEKIWTAEEIKDRRNQQLSSTDWVVLEDSKYVVDPANASMLAKIKTFRQALRDMPSHAQVLDSTWPSDPTDPILNL